MVPTYPIILFIQELFLFLYLQGLNLLEFTAQLEEKAAQLRHKGLGRIKIALAGTDTSSLLEILEGQFGHVNLDTSVSSTSTEKSKKKTTTEGKTSDVPEKNPSHSFQCWWLSYCRAIISFEVCPPIIAGLPEAYLPLCGPETLS